MCDNCADRPSSCGPTWSSPRCWAPCFRKPVQDRAGTGPCTAFPAGSCWHSKRAGTKTRGTVRAAPALRVRTLDTGTNSAASPDALAGGTEARTLGGCCSSCSAGHCCCCCCKDRVKEWPGNRHDAVATRSASVAEPAATVLATVLLVTGL